MRKLYSFCKLIIFIIIDDEENIYNKKKHIFIRDMKNILTELKKKDEKLNYYSRNARKIKNK